MFKKIILCALTLTMLIPITASAQALTTTKTNPTAKVVTTQSARAPYASELKLERQTIKDNYQTNKTIMDSIKGKMAQVKTLISQNKANKTLKSKNNALKAERAIMKSDRATLKSINVTLIADNKNAKIDKDSKNYVALVSDLKNISPVQTSKIPVLQKISSDLDTLISIL